jgi:hypothetical protein
MSAARTALYHRGTTNFLSWSVVDFEAFAGNDGSPVGGFDVELV